METILGSTVKYKGPIFQCEYPILLTIDPDVTRYVTEVDCEYNRWVETDYIRPSYFLHQMLTSYYIYKRFDPDDDTYWYGV